MSCLGGTVEQPEPWVRYRSDESFERHNGRICTRTSPRTSRRACAQCPAFRGLRWDGTVANGLALDGVTVLGLTLDEHNGYREAVERQVYDDEDDLMFLWYARQYRELVTNPDGSHAVVRGIGQRGLLRIGDPDAVDRHAASMRAWRKSHPGYDKRRRKRAEYMRAYRAGRKVGA